MSASSATCSTWPTTATTSTARSRTTPPRSPTSRSPTPPVAGSPAAASSTSRGSSPPWSSVGMPGGSAWSTSQPPRPRRRASAGYRGSAAPPTDRKTLKEKQMSTVAFIGLGIMGSPMAVHLENAGFDVVGYNPSPEKAKPLLEAGGRSAGSIAEAVKDADVVAVMVPDSPDVQDVLAGAGGVFESAQPVTLVIDFSSFRPDVTTELAEQAAERGFRLLDAPVSGGEAGAKNAALSIMVGGTAEDFAQARPIFE